MTKEEAIEELKNNVEDVKYRNQEVVLLSKAIEMVEQSEEEYWHDGEPPKAGIYEITEYTGRVFGYEYRGAYFYDTHNMFFLKDNGMEIINYDNVKWHHVPSYVDKQAR